MSDKLNLKPTFRDHLTLVSAWFHRCTDPTNAAQELPDDLPEDSMREVVNHSWATVVLHSPEVLFEPEVLFDQKRRAQELERYKASASQLKAEADVLEGCLDRIAELFDVSDFDADDEEALNRLMDAINEHVRNADRQEARAAAIWDAETGADYARHVAGQIADGMRERLQVREQGGEDRIAAAALQLARELPPRSATTFVMGDLSVKVERR